MICSLINQYKQHNQSSTQSVALHGISALPLYYAKRAQNKQYPKLLNKQVLSIQNDIAITNRFTNTQI